MNFHGDFSPRNRTTDAPVAMEIEPRTVPSPTLTFAPNLTLAGSPLPLKTRLRGSWAAMSGYLIAGIFLGVVLIFALSIGRSTHASAAMPPPAANAILDNVVRLHARDIGSTCWAGIDRPGPARLTVALEVGIDGKIRYAAASGETPSMRECVETHVKSWDFLPQAQAQTMALPFEIDRK